MQCRRNALNTVVDFLPQLRHHIKHCLWAEFFWSKLYWIVDWNNPFFFHKWIGNNRARLLMCEWKRSNNLLNFQMMQQWRIVCRDDVGWCVYLFSWQMLSHLLKWHFVPFSIVWCWSLNFTWHCSERINQKPHQIHFRCRTLSHFSSLFFWLRFSYFDVRYCVE